MPPRDTAADRLAANLAALERRWGWLPDLSHAHADAIRIDGGLAIHAPDGRWLPVHDMRDPLADAQRWVDSRWPADRQPSAACVIGAGLGFVVEHLLDRVPELPVLVLEPEPALAVAMLSRRDWRRAIDAGRLMILVAPDYRGHRDAARLFRTASPPCVLPHPTICGTRVEAAKAAARIVAAAQDGARLNDAARERLAGRYTDNTNRNLAVIASEADVAALFGLVSGSPVVVAAAGPSLDRNMDELRPWRDRVTLVAVDTAARPLVAAQLAPDFIVAVDPSDVNARHLDDLHDCGAALVAEGSLAASALEPFRGRIFTFRVGAHDPWPRLQSNGLDRALLRTWGSVTTTAYDLAMKLGGNPIVFIGADLAYTHDRPYARGITFEREWSTQGRPIEDVFREIVFAPETVEASDVNGAPVRTTPTLVAFRDWLAEQAVFNGRRVWNATGAGILSIPNRDSLAAILRHAPPRPPIRDLIASAYARSARR